MSSEDLTRLARALEAALLDEGVKSVASNELMRRLLAMLADVDNVSYKRLAADYLDGGGKLRLEPTQGKEPLPQLDLFAEASQTKKKRKKKSEKRGFSLGLNS